MRKSHTAARWLMPLFMVGVLGATSCEQPYQRSISHVKRDKKRSIARQLTSVRTVMKETRDQLLLSRERVTVVLTTEHSSKAAIDSVSVEVHRCESRRRVLATRLTSAETNAEGVFLDWDRERRDMSNADLREASRVERRATREGFDRCLDAARDALRSLSPALELLSDQATLLRHSDTTAAINAASQTLPALDARVQEAVNKLDAAIMAIDEFVRTLESAEGAAGPR